MLLKHTIFQGRIISATYHAKCSQAQQNQAFEIGGILHTDGSITRYEHAIRMVSTLNTTNFDSL